jgi:hypothetical protein
LILLSLYSFLLSFEALVLKYVKLFHWFITPRRSQQAFVLPGDRLSDLLEAVLEENAWFKIQRSLSQWWLVHIGLQKLRRTTKPGIAFANVSPSVHSHLSRSSNRPQFDSWRVPRRPIAAAVSVSPI